MHRRRKRLILLTEVASVALLLGFVYISSASAHGECGVDFGNHYAGKAVVNLSRDIVYTHCEDPPYYFGYLGINGDLETPSTAHVPDPNTGHFLSDLNMYLKVSPGDNWWIQIGYYTGTVGNASGSCPKADICVRHTQGFAMYYEWLAGNQSNGYFVKEVAAGSPWPAQTHKILKVDHDDTYIFSSYCFQVFRDYNIAIDRICTDVVGGVHIQAKVGSPEVTSESQNTFPGIITWPAAFFGTERGNTNNTFTVTRSKGLAGLEYNIDRRQDGDFL